MISSKNVLPNFAKAAFVLLSTCLATTALANPTEKDDYIGELKDMTTKSESLSADELKSSLYDEAKELNVDAHADDAKDKAMEKVEELEAEKPE